MVGDDLFHMGGEAVGSEGGIHPLSRQTFIHAQIHTYRQNTVQITCMSLGGGRKPEGTHAHANSTQKDPPRPGTKRMALLM